MTAPSLMPRSRTGSAGFIVVARYVRSHFGALAAVLAVAASAWTLVAGMAYWTYADSIVPVLMSLYRWEPFFWGTARYGMLVPALATPISHPLWNLLFQYLISAASLIAAPMMISRFVYGPRTGVLVGMPSAIVLLAVYANTNMLFVYSAPGQPYGMALAFCYGGLSLWDAAARRGAAWRWLAGAILILSAMWLCPSVAFNAIAVTVAGKIISHGFTSLQDQERGWWPRVSAAIRLPGVRMALFVFAALVASVVLTIIVSTAEGETLTGILTPRDWIERQGLQGLMNGFFLWFLRPSQYSIPVLLTLYVGALVSVLAMAATAAKTGALAGSASLLAGVMAEVCMLSAMRYVATNQFSGHYLFSCLVLLVIVPIGLIVVPLARKWHSGVGYAAGILPVVLVVTTFVGYGWPSVRKVRRALDESCGRYSPDIVAHHVTHFAGSYWRVWPAVFHANLQFYESGSPRRLWGITTRAGSSRPLWDTFDSESNIIGSPAGEDIGPYLSAFDITAIPTGGTRTVSLYRSVPRRDLRVSAEPPLWLVRAPSPGLACCLDTINGQRQGVVSLGVKQPLSLLGWAGDIETGAVPVNIAIQLRSLAGERYFVPVARMPRPDVSGGFKKIGLLRSGFVVTVKDLELPPGRYAITVLQGTTNHVWECDTTKTLAVR